MCYSTLSLKWLKVHHKINSSNEEKYVPHETIKRISITHKNLQSYATSEKECVGILKTCKKMKLEKHIFLTATRILS